MAERTEKEVLGVKLVPLNVPWERRLQTGAVLLYTGLFVMAPFIATISFILTMFTPLFFVALAYGVWMYYDIFVQATSSRGGRRIDFVRRLKVWEHFRDFFPISLVKTTELDPSKNYLMGYHPHGILGCGSFCNFATEATDFSGKFKGITPHLLTLKANFSYPLLRGLLLYHGVCDVSKESIRYILTKKGTGNAAIIVIGGAAEALEAKPGNYNINLKQRKGFVKVALKAGASLVPIFSFGENDLFCQANNPVGSLLRNFQEIFKNILGFSPPLFYGRGVFNYTFGLIPFRKPVHTVVGAPIDLPMVEQPTQEDIDKYHTAYMDGLSQLFDDHKVEYGVDKNTNLNFI